MARPKSDDPVLFVKVGLRKAEWDHVMMWKPGDMSETRCLGELVERSMKMYPLGPSVFGHQLDPDKPRSRRRVPQAVAKYAERLGVTRNDALAEIAARYIAEHPEEFKGQ